MPFCYAPWTNIDISPSGNVTPCCKFQTDHYTQKFNIQNTSIDEYADSEFVAEIKQQFKQGEWPVGCERCKIEENNGIESKRILDYTRWKEYYNNYDLDSNKFITSSIAFGNTCNLKCITCGPHSSSRWQKEYFDLYQVDVPHHKFYKNNFVRDFVKHAPHMIHVDIPGGEPFLSGVKEQQELLNYYIDNGQAKEISLHYTTNGTVFPDDVWWSLWKNFKEIDLQLSIDGVGNRYEYIRYPANWSELTNNVGRYVANEKQLDNVRLSVSHTVSAYNIYYLDEFVSWCYTVGLPKPWFGRVHNPIHMRPTVWPQNVCASIADHLNTSEHSDVRVWAELVINENDSEHFEMFRNKMQQHDQYRGLDFDNTFPELTKYL
jgi:radical SAM protein with 4Fe4S-binding SPASM domain